MFGSLKPGFRSLATLKLVVNVVGELHEKNRCGIARAVSLRQHGFLVFLVPQGAAGNAVAIDQSVTNRLPYLIHVSFLNLRAASKFELPQLRCSYTRIVC